MKSLLQTYKFGCIALLVAILPSMLGVHIFQHHCMDCKQDEVITRMVTTTHSHNHSCADCACESACQTCYAETGQHIHHHATTNEACHHEFKRGSFEGQTASLKIKFQAESIELFSQAPCLAENIFLHRQYFDVDIDAILKIPDKPTPEKTCVFRL